ncbi:MAG: hypothetical protein V4594_20965 [Bacteroidota bacterium]
MNNSKTTTGKPSAQLTDKEFVAAFRSSDLMKKKNEKALELLRRDLKQNSKP